MTSNLPQSSKKIVCFIYRKPKWGSTIMRVFQLCQILDRFLGEECEFRIYRLPGQSVPGAQWIWSKTLPVGAHYVFAKSCLSKLDENALDTIRRKAAMICFDHVDGDLLETPKSGCDFHICTSYAQKHAVERLIANGEMGPGTPFVILHNNDVRLENVAPASQTVFRTLYLGMGHNLVLPDKLKSRVDVFDLGKGITFDDVVPKLPDYPFHYGIRPPRAPREEIYKPFLKGFIAAKCGANILAHRDTDDAVHFLGSEYPYLVADISPEAIDEVLRRAKDGFGSREWTDALDVMHDIETKVAPRAIAERFRSLISGS